MWTPVRWIKVPNPVDRPSPPAVPGGGGQQWSVDRHKGRLQDPPKVVRRQDDVATFQLVVLCKQIRLIIFDISPRNEMLKPV